MTLYTHLLPLDKASQDRVRGTDSQQTAGRTALQSTPSAQPTGSEPGKKSLTGHLGGDGASELARALSELGNPADPGFQTLPVFASTDGSDDSEEVPVDDGYYTITRVRTQPVQPAATGPLAQYDLTLKTVGTRQSQWRSVQTAPTALDATDFGSTAESPTVAIPAAAPKTYWYDPVSGAVTPATPTATVASAGGDLARYDPTAASADVPRLVYDVEYEDQVDTGCVLWDRYGDVQKTNADGTVQWRPVYSRAHEFRGAAVASTRRVRLLVDDATGLLGAERYSAGSWSTVSLGTPSAWGLSHVDVTGVDPAVLQLQCWFETDSDLFALDARLRRGADGIVWSVPENETGPVPSGLIDLLAPTAADTYEVAGATTTTLSREEVRR